MPEISTLVPSLVRDMRKAGKLQKLGGRHLDKAKSEKLVNGKNSAHLNKKRLEPKWLRKNIFSLPSTDNHSQLFL